MELWRRLALAGFSLTFFAGGVLVIWAISSPHDIQHAYLAPVGAPATFLGFIGVVALLEGYFRRQG